MEAIPKVHILTTWLKKRSTQYPLHRTRPMAVTDTEGQKKFSPGPLAPQLTK